MSAYVATQYSSKNHNVSGMDDEVTRMNSVHEAVMFLTYGQRAQTLPPPKLREVLDIADYIGDYVRTGKQPDWDAIKRRGNGDG